MSRYLSNIYIQSIQHYNNISKWAVCYERFLHNGERMTTSWTLDVLILNRRIMYIRTPFYAYYPNQEIVKRIEQVNLLGTQMSWEGERRHPKASTSSIGIRQKEWNGQEFAGWTQNLLKYECKIVFLHICID